MAFNGTSRSEASPRLLSDTGGRRGRTLASSSSRSALRGSAALSGFSTINPAGRIQEDSALSTASRQRRPSRDETEDALQLVAGQLFTIMAGDGAARGQLRKDDYDQVMACNRSNLAPALAMVFPGHAFQLMDTKKQGVVKRSTFIKFVTQGQGHSGKSLHDFCQLLREFANVLDPSAPKSSELKESSKSFAQVQSVFKKMDLDGSGEVTLKEFQAFQRAMSCWCDPDIMEESILGSACFDELDEGRDGKICFQDFNAFMGKIRQQVGEECFLNLVGQQLVGWEQACIRRQRVRNGLGKLQASLGELTKARNKELQSTCHEVSSALFEVLDQDNFHVLRQAEFLRFAELLGDLAETWVWTPEDFSKLDQDGDGKITVKELHEYLWQAMNTFGRRMLVSQLHHVLEVLRREVEKIEGASSLLQDIVATEAPQEELHGRLTMLCCEAATASMTLRLFQRLFCLAAECIPVPAEKALASPWSPNSKGSTSSRPSVKGELWRLSRHEQFGPTGYLDTDMLTRNPIEEFVLLPAGGQSAAFRSKRACPDWTRVELRAASHAPLHKVDPVIELRCFLRLSSRAVRISVTFHQLRDAAQTAAARGTPPSLLDLRTLLTGAYELRLQLKSGKVRAADLLESTDATKKSEKGGGDFESARAKLPTHGLTNLRLAVPDGEYAATVAHWPSGQEMMDPHAAVAFDLKDLRRRYHMADVHHLSWTATCNDGREHLEVEMLHPCLEEPVLSMRSEASLKRYHRYVAAGGDLCKLLRSTPAVVIVSASSSEDATAESRSTSELSRTFEASLEATGCWVTINLWPPWLACLSGVIQCSAYRSLRSPKSIQAAAQEFATEFAQTCSNAAAQSGEKSEVMKEHLEALRSEARLRVRRLHCALQQCPDGGPLGEDAINVPSRAAALSRCIRAIDSLEAVGGSTPLDILTRCFKFTRFNLGFELAQAILSRNPTLLMPKSSEATSTSAGYMAAEQVLNHEPPLHPIIRGQVLEYLHKHGAKLSTLFAPMVRHHRCDDVVLLFEVCLGERGMSIKSQGFGKEPLRKTLHSAAAQGDAEKVRSIIINSKLSPDARDRNGQTAAHHAAWHGHLDVLEVLHLCRSNFNVTDNDGATALHYATSTAVEKLRLWGCSPSAINKNGCTPLMLSRQRKKQYGALFQSAALEPKVQWTQIESILTTDDSLDTMIKSLLKLGFGSESPEIFQKGSEGGKVINPSDELQIRNQLDDQSGFQRARQLCTCLVVPCLELAGKKKLNDPDSPGAGIPRKSFCKYLLGQRVASFAPAEILACAAIANSRLLRELHAIYENPENNVLRSLTAKASARVKDGVELPVTDKKDLWLHQRTAHGPLPWLEGRDDLEAVAVMVELGLFETAEDLCDWGAANWGRDALYALYLLAVAKSADKGFQKTMEALVAGVPGAEYFKGGLKGQERMLFKGRGEYADQAFAAYGDIDLGVGGVVDICRLSICCDTAEVLCHLVKDLNTKRLERDGVEVIRVKNGFHPEASAGAGYRDVKLAMLISAPELPGAPRHIAECQLLLRPYLELKKFQHVLYEIERGDFFDKRVRTAMEVLEVLAPNSRIAEDKLERLPKIVEAAYTHIYTLVKNETDIDIAIQRRRWGAGGHLMVVLEEAKQQEKLAPLEQEQEDMERATRIFVTKSMRSSELKPRVFDEWLMHISSEDALCKVLAMLKLKDIDLDSEPMSPASPVSPSSPGKKKRLANKDKWMKATDDIARQSRRARSPGPVAARAR